MYVRFPILCNTHAYPNLQRRRMITLPPSICIHYHYCIMPSLYPFKIDRFRVPQTTIQRTCLSMWGSTGGDSELRTSNSTDPTAVSSESPVVFGDVFCFRRRLQQSHERNMSLDDPKMMTTTPGTVECYQRKKTYHMERHALLA